MSYGQVLEKVSPQKGYILSIDLQEKECEKIWSKQVPLFQKNNPHIKDPNILQIGEEITVQNCKKVAVEEKKEEVKVEVVEEKVQEQAVEQKQEEKDSLFVGLKYVNQKINKKDNDEAKEGHGYLLTVGKKIKLEDKELKLSAGLMRLKTSYDVQGFELSGEATTLSLNASYLFNKGNFQIGPAASILASNGGLKFDNFFSKDKRVDGLVGLELGYKINKSLTFGVDVKNQLENRVKLISTIGLELNF